MTDTTTTTTTTTYVKAGERVEFPENFPIKSLRGENLLFIGPVKNRYPREQYVLIFWNDRFTRALPSKDYYPYTCTASRSLPKIYGFNNDRFSSEVCPRLILIPASMWEEAGGYKFCKAGTGGSGGLSAFLSKYDPTFSCKPKMYTVVPEWELISDEMYNEHPDVNWIWNERLSTATVETSADFDELEDEECEYETDF